MLQDLIKGQRSNILVVTITTGILLIVPQGFDGKGYGGGRVQSRE
jgi:hypothetical protein